MLSDWVILRRISKNTGVIPARMSVAKLGRPFKEVINEALRMGLDELMQPAESKPYHTAVFPWDSGRD